MGSLRFPAFLLVLLYTTVVQISEELINMGMFPEAPDYSFYKCRKEMLQMVTKTGGLLQKELNSSTEFKSMWQDNAKCKEAIPGGRPEHMTALNSYVANDKFREEFNKIHRKIRGSSTYQDEFPFKSLFFLLSDAMELLKNNCKTVYSGTEDDYSAKTGEEVRFKSFFPAKLGYSAAVEDAVLGDFGTVFNITSCSVISLDDLNCKGEEIDLLISPTEVFKVKNIRNVGIEDDKVKVITLIHSRFQSSSNCSSLNSVPEPKGSKESSSSLLSPSRLNPMSSLLLLYFYTLTL